MNITALAHEVIQVDVQYYDLAERQKLLRYPTREAMENLVKEPLEVTKAEFLTYYLFHRIKLGTPDYQDYATVSRRLCHWLGAIGECIDFEANTVRTPEGAERQLAEVSEHVGEAIGLAVMNRIHGLTEADWRPIPEQRGRGAAPSFDFQLASDGKHFVQVETKGSSVMDNRVLSDAVRAQKRKIDDKKVKLVALEKEGQDPNPASLRYGTIAVVDGRMNGIMRCLLTDPPPHRLEDTPRRFKLLNRIRHFRDWISFISPHSELAAALSTRVADMEHLEDPFQLDRVWLRRGTGEQFNIVPHGPTNWRHSSFMLSKSRVRGDAAGGIVVQLSERALFFLGIREEMLVLAAVQDFEKIFDYLAETSSADRTVECKFSSGRFSKLKLPPSVRQSVIETGPYSYIVREGNLHYSPEGLVFGILPLPEQ